MVGSEHSFFLALKRELESLRIKTQYFDGLLEADGGGDSPYILSAHVDRHGLICTGPDEFQYAALTSQFIGEQDGNSVSEQLIDKITDRFLGERVQAYEPRSGAYLGQGKIRAAFFCDIRQNLVFEVDGLTGLFPGIPLAYNDALTLSDGYVSAQLDNVLSVAMIVDLYRKGYKGKALFSAQEEAGRSWRFLLSYFRRQEHDGQSILVLDTTPFPNKSDLDTVDIVFRNQDANGMFSPELTKQLVDVAEALSIPYLKKDEYIQAENIVRVKAGKNETSLGRTELGRLSSASNGAFTGSTIQFPSTDYHSSDETVSLRSIESVSRFLSRLLIS